MLNKIIRFHFSFFFKFISASGYFLLVAAGSKLRFGVDAKFKTGRIRKLLKFATFTSYTSGHLG